MVKLPDILKLNKGMKEQAEIDKIIEMNVHDGKDKSDVVHREVIPRDADEAARRMGMDIDKLKAEVESFKQIRQLNEQRFQRISEEIGDLRRSGIEREKDINLMKMKAAKAVDLVGSVQPEKLRIDLERGDAKITKLEAKISADEELLSHMSDEIKKVKQDTEAFRGIEAIIQLNEDVKQELANVKKVELTVEKHADKVEEIFVNMQKRFSEFLKMSEKFEALEKSLNAFMKDASKIKVQFDDLVTKDEMGGIKADVDSIKSIASELKGKRDEVDSIVSSANSSIARLESLQKELKPMEDAKYITEERFDKELEDLYNNVIKRMEGNRAPE